MAADPIGGHRSRPAAPWRDATAKRAALVTGLTCALAVLGPIRSSYELARESYGPFAAVASLQLSDVPLLALAVVVLPGALTRRRRTWATVVLAALAAWMVLALVVHPSAPGALHVARLVGAVSVATAVREVLGGPGAATLVRALLLSTGFQAVLALAQVVNDGPLGLTALGERQRLEDFGGQAAGQGTFNHPYIFVGWTVVVLAVVAAHRRRPAATAALDDVCMVAIGAGAGVSFSRAAAVGVVVAAAPAVAAARRHRALLRPMALAAVGLAVAAATFNGGWASRVRSTTSAATSRSLEAASTDRGVLAGDALEIIGDAPAAGVGPSRYLAGLERLGDVAPDDFKPVHDVPLLAAAEGGVPAGLLVLALLAVLTVTAVRAGALALAAGALYAPFVLLDHFPYYSVQGLLATATLIAVVDHLRAPADDD